MLINQSDGVIFGWARLVPAGPQPHYSAGQRSEASQGVGQRERVLHFTLGLRLEERVKGSRLCQGRLLLRRPGGKGTRRRCGSLRGGRAGGGGLGHSEIGSRGRRGGSGRLQRRGGHAGGAGGGGGGVQRGGGDGLLALLAPLAPPRLAGGSRLGALLLFLGICRVPP